MDKYLELDISLKEEDLEILERRLSIAVSKLQPGTVRGVGEPGELMQVPRKTELSEIKSEIIDGYKCHAKIASHTESTPLVSLFESAQIQLPPEMKVDYEQMNYEFYLVRVTFSIMLPKDQFPLSADFQLTLSDDTKNSTRQTRPIRLFPGHKDIDLFRVDIEGSVGIDAGMSISTQLAGSDILPFTKVAADANLKTKVVVGPFSFHFRKAAIEVKGESDPTVFWRYNIKSELFGTNDFRSFLILKIPKEAKSVQMLASLGVVPSKHRWKLFKDVLPRLSDHQPLEVELVSRNN